MADLLNPASGGRLPATRQPDPHGSWVRRNVLTRLAAAVWWVVMAFFDIWIVAAWISVAMNPTLVRAGLTLVLTVVAGIPIVHEWSNARRMGRMLIHGT